MTQDQNNSRTFQPKTKDGEFVRTDSVFRNWITANDVTGVSGDDNKIVFPAETDRYHLYISHACPWASRAMIFRKLKNLESLISVDVVHPLMGARSWHFGSFEGSTLDTINGCEFMDEVYQLADPEYSGVVTVPLLWDKKQGTAVNNESSEIIRMFNSAFNTLTGNDDDYYPESLRPEIDTINDIIYESVNNGVYRCGFASSQSAYEDAVVKLFATLDMLEERLQGEQWLVGDTQTEADWRLFPTLVRFDSVYHGHFKCNIRRLQDYPNLYAYTQRLYNQPGIAETVHMHQIKTHYYASHKTLNPSGIVPRGPESPFEQH